jgi:hypothetical protein
VAEYTVVSACSARRELERLEAGVARRIISRVEALAKDPRPHGCVKLQGAADLCEFASETTASSTCSTTTRASWTSASYDTEAMLTGSGGHAPNHGMQPTADDGRG